MNRVDGIHPQIVHTQETPGPPLSDRFTQFYSTTFDRTNGSWGRVGEVPSNLSTYGEHSESKR